jgi:hypothetical protein
VKSVDLSQQANYKFMVNFTLKTDKQNGARTRVEFGTRKFDITTDGIFNITEPVFISQQFLVPFKLILNAKEIKKLRRFCKAVHVHFQTQVHTHIRWS